MLIYSSLFISPSPEGGGQEGAHSTFLIPPSTFITPSPEGGGQEGAPQFTYRLAGNSCLAGDYIDAYQFDHKLQIGENIIFQDMIHYTTVKTHMFNGLTHPDIAILHNNGQLQILRQFTYQDYLNRMD